MGIELKSIKQLKGMAFYIPSYQRGYRWTDQQVKDLLNDINEFKQGESDDGYYCLQPIVVKGKKSEKDILAKINEKKGNFEKVDEVKQLLMEEWEVIDGQQRLTTIYIILEFLKERNFFELEYETRKEIKNFLSNIETNSGCKNDNWDIDSFYMRAAYEQVREWFEKKINEIEKNGDGNVFKSTFKDKFLGKVKVIWYESAEEDPVKVFTRLNIGKISLTNAELIKALFLNRSNFKGEVDEHLKLRQQEIASEWDNIEYTLQNDEFWLFLHDKGYTNPTRIDFIFDIICDSDKLEVKDEIVEKRGTDWEYIIGTDEYKTFRYFYEYFQLEEHDIDKCWQIVKKYFQIFNEWYNDLTLYHYIGYCVIECKNYNIKALVDCWEKRSNKESFVNFLKDAIKEKIDSCPLLNFKYNEDGSNKRACEPLLLFHNIQTVINQNTRQQENEKYQVGVFYRFPFNLYKIEKWDVEHINPNTENPEDDESTRGEWLINVYLGAEGEEQKKIEEYFETTEEDKREDLFAQIKDIFKNQDEWSQQDKNRIWNYTLLDSSTNRSYGNSIFPSKRRIIIGKDKGVLIPLPKLKNDLLDTGEETRSPSSFIPPCTKQVFLKYYSSAIGNNNYWQKKDAFSYFLDMAKCIRQIYRHEKINKNG